MQEKLLTYLKCLKCSVNDFDLNIKEKNEIEIREGSINCKKCGQNYTVHNGIACYLINPLPEAEIKSDHVSNLKNRNIPEVNSEDSILRMPYLRSKNSKCYYEGLAVNFDSMVERMELSKDSSILDIGAQNCWTTNRFAEKGCYSVAIDLRTTKNSGLESSDYFIQKGIYFERVQADMNNLPFNNESFDYVFFNNVLHHSGHIDRVIEQTYHILKKGGKIVLTGEPSYGIFSKKGEFGKEEKVNLIENIYPFPMYRKFLKKTGFKKISFFFPPAVDLKLSSGKSGWQNVSEDLFEFINFFWRRRWLQRFLKKILFYPAAILYNFQVHCIAEKK